MAGSGDSSTPSTTTSVPISRSPARSNVLFRVPPSFRVNAEVYEPHFFHFSRYTPRFFPPPYQPIDGVTNGDSHINQNYYADRRFKEIMAKDLFGKAQFNSLIDKILEGQLLEEIKDIYTDIPRQHMDAVPKDILAKLFAYSAVVIVGSVVFHPNFEGMTQKVSEINMPVVSPECPIPYPVAYRRYAMEDAVMVMENQIPVRLLQLACEALCDSERSLYSIQFKTESILANTFSSEKAATRLLVYVLRIYLLFVDPFPDSLWEAGELQKTEQWIKNNSLKPLIAYVYDCLLAPLPPYTPINRPVHTSEMSTTCSEFCPRCLSTNTDDTRGRMLTASQLRMRGVMLLRQQNRDKGIQYNPKTMELYLPIINIDGRMLRLLRNVMAYELTSSMDGNPFCSHVVFLDYLIDKEEDIDVLVKAKVLGNYMARSNASVADIMDGLMKFISVDLTPKHRDVVEMLLRSRRGQCWLWWSLFKERFWERQPWLVFSVVAASVLLVMTALQTFRE